MRNKVAVYVIGIMLFVIFIAGACSAGFVAGRYATPAARIAVTNDPSVQPVQPDVSVGQPTQEGAAPNDQQVQPEVILPTPDPAVRESTPRDNQKLFDPFWQVWDIVHQEFVDQPVDDVALMRGAIQGMLGALGDQHTSYMDPDQFMQANMSLGNEYEGIGAWVDTNAEFLTIVSPMPDSPAERAGLKPGDMIIAVDGEDMTGIDGNLVIRKVLGPAGSTVHFTVRRPVEGAEPEEFEVDVTRAKIIVHSVTGKMLDNGIAYVSINSFSEKTRDELHTVLEDLMSQNPRGLIVDVRNNGGGYLDTAIQVSSEFIKEGNIVMYEEYGNGQRDVYKALPGGLATDVPMILLINEGSASASEILAGAIQDYARGQLVGVTSYGKGSVQNWIPLNGGDEGAVRVTIARWYTPENRQISEIGLEPDVTVELTDEDIKAGRDPQLDKAVELLSQQ